MPNQHSKKPGKPSAKIQELLLARERIKEKIRNIETRFKEEETENEEAWPGHEGTRYQSLELDHQLLLEHLTSIEKELKKLG